MTAPSRFGKNSRRRGAYTEPSAVTEKTPVVERSVPILHLLRGVVEVEKCAHSRRPPARYRAKKPHEVHDAFGSAADARIALEAALGVGQLDRIDVDGHDFVLRGELHRRTARRRDAEHAASRTERVELDRRVFVHPSKKHLPRTDTRVEAASFPDGHRRAHGHILVGRLAETQASTRNAKFFTIIPRGS